MVYLRYHEDSGFGPKFFFLNIIQKNTYQKRKQKEIMLKHIQSTFTSRNQLLSKLYPNESSGFSL